MLASSPAKSPRLHSSPSLTSIHHFHRSSNASSYRNASSSPRIGSSRITQSSPQPTTAGVIVKTEDASRQYSPGEQESQQATKDRMGKKISKVDESARARQQPAMEETSHQPPDLLPRSPSTKRSSSAANLPSSEKAHISSPKRAKAKMPDDKILPARYEFCSTGDLVAMMSTMIADIMTINDKTQGDNPKLTRFHSRVAPGISVRDYLQRLTTHLALQPVILLTMLFYIDRLCSLYQEFTVNSLTCHRFLITAATVATKGLSDSFWNNSTYSRVGGVKLSELALLELEFLYRVDWRIIPDDALLVSYYNGLITRTDGYTLARPAPDNPPDSNETNSSKILATQTDGLTLTSQPSEEQLGSAEANGSHNLFLQTDESAVAQPPLERQSSSSGHSRDFLTSDEGSPAQEIETSESTPPVLQATQENSATIR